MVTSDIQLSSPTSEDGMAVNKLVSACPPLDGNSVYCNLLQAGHFSDTCVAAKQGDELVGFVSGYLLPASPSTLFVWQVAVGERARGKGLAKTMLLALLSRANCAKVSHIETTITKSNQASWALFRALAKQLNAPLNETLMFEKERHFEGLHDSEYLVRIGPIAA